MIQNGQKVIVRTDTIFIDNKPVIVKAQPVVIKIEEYQFGDTIASPNPVYTKPRVPMLIHLHFMFIQTEMAM